MIAYEPVWAIGTGRNATDAQAQEVHAYIRQHIAKCWNKDFADRVRIQYGGSMKPENARGLLSQPDVDGGLIGGASLKADGFLAIARGRTMKKIANCPRSEYPCLRSYIWIFLPLFLFFCVV